MTIDNAAGGDNPFTVAAATSVKEDVQEAGGAVEAVGEAKKKEVGKFEAEMREGKYLQILETYAVSWPTEKVARDVLQNFFDGNGGTLDGVEIDIKENETGDSVVRIEGGSQYDYRKLVHLGGSSKTNSDSSVGGFGEGAKIMSLIMLRDMGIEDVTFGSGDWQLKFSLNDVDEESYDQKVRGLFAKLEKVLTPIDGNFFQFTIPKDNSKKEEYLEVFGSVSDLFRHSDNPDFQNPIFENEDFGIVYLGKGDDDKGNYYDGGQRRHVDRDEWQTIEGFNIWSTKLFFKQDRDRGVINEYKLVDQLLKPMFRKLSTEDVSKIFWSLEEIWIPPSQFSSGIKTRVISTLVDELSSREITFVFGDEYLCNDRYDYKTEDYAKSLKDRGYKICGSEFGKIGMKAVAAELFNNQLHYAKEVDNNGRVRIDLLMSTAEKILSGNQKLSSQSLPVLPIYIFSRENEKSIVAGQYNGDFIWMIDGILDGSFSEALSTYLHELSHKSGSDQSAAFSYTLTDCQTAVIDFLINADEGEIKKIKDTWAATKK